MWVHIFAPLERPLVDDGRHVASNGADVEWLLDRGAVYGSSHSHVSRALDFAVQHSLVQKPDDLILVHNLAVLKAILGVEFLKTEHVRRVDAQTGCAKRNGGYTRHSFGFGSYVLFVSLGRLSRACTSARACSNSSMSTASVARGSVGVLGRRHRFGSGEEREERER